jgi:hypothetical protein
VTIRIPSGEAYDLESVTLESQEASRKHVPIVKIWRIIFSKDRKSCKQNDYQRLRSAVS